MWSRRVLYALLLLTFLQGESAKVLAQPATVTADFGSRAGNLRRVPSDMFGVNPVQLQDPAALKLVTQAGFTQARKMSSISTVYGNPTPNWSSFDWNMSKMQAAGLHPIVVLALTPTWLQPSPNPCSGISNPENAPPTDVQKWAQLTASYVAHLDAMFPGLVQDFEVWNEPDLQKSFCVADNNDTTRLRVYLGLYAAAASAMRAQATQDGTTIRIGGPTICVASLADEWVGALLSNRQTAPNVDFVSFHLYLSGSGISWSTLLSKTQGSKGALATYTHVANLVARGSQPNAGSTPIYITEFNGDWEFVQDCCRNDPTYAPLWNSIFLADLLNSAYAGANTPARLYYFAGSFPPFCLMGKWDSNMDCDPSQSDPYPQYYAFQLFAAADHFGLANGGQMAASLTAANPPAGLITTAFLTDSKDILVLINPTSVPYSQLSLVAANPGFSSVAATANLLNSENPHTSESALQITKTFNGYTATVDVPPYSVMAVALGIGQLHDVPPTAVLAVTPQLGVAPLSVTADSSGSYDSDGSIASQTIDFGDGSTPANSITAPHTYTLPGIYPVHLTVTDNAGLISQAIVKVTVSASNNVDPDFILNVAPDPSNTTVYGVTVTPVSSVDEPVSFSCPQVPQGMTCAFSPVSVVPGTNPAKSVLTIGPTGARSQVPLLPHQPIGVRLAIWLVLPGIVLLGPGTLKSTQNKVRLRIATLGLLMLLALAFEMGCAGLSKNATTTQTTKNNPAVVLASSRTHTHTVTIYVGQ
jgi:PKD repeat protein